MKVSDYIVEYIIGQGITDVFGYPGGMVTHLMDSFHKYKDSISAHVTYHEQGAAFAACGYAQVSGKPGVAYATSGPGATNLITGICNAYFDSIPVLFITGQVNTFESKGSFGVRQRGFQETDIVSMVSPVVKYAAYVESAEKIKFYLDTALEKAMSGRKGPVLLDIPMNIFRAEVDPDRLIGADSENPKESVDRDATISTLTKLFEQAERPCFLLGNGIKSAQMQSRVRKLLNEYAIPAVTSMIAFDVCGDSPYNYGFVGAYGDRSANFTLAKCDLLITIGSRLDIRQVGAKRENFAPDAKVVRFDVDAGELDYPVHEDEVGICASLEETLDVLEKVSHVKDYSAWIHTCDEIRELLKGRDDTPVRNLINRVSEDVPENTVITTDVGQNQVWVAQAFQLKAGQKVLFSGGHGAMGYSLPAAIGACYATGKKPVVCITGDGGLQMNIQELQMIVRDKLPIKIVVVNNDALGMIRHFQEMYFENRYYQTKPEGGYTSPDFAAIGKAYGIDSKQCLLDDYSGDQLNWTEDRAQLIEVLVRENTYVFPKLEYGKPNQDQEPLLDRELYERIMNMGIVATNNGGGNLIILTTEKWLPCKVVAA